MPAELRAVAEDLPIKWLPPAAHEIFASDPTQTVAGTVQCLVHTTMGDASLQTHLV